MFHLIHRASVVTNILHEKFGPGDEANAAHAHGISMTESLTTGLPFKKPMRCMSPPVKYKLVIFLLTDLVAVKKAGRISYKFWPCLAYSVSTQIFMVSTATTYMFDP